MQGLWLPGAQAGITHASHAAIYSTFLSYRTFSVHHKPCTCIECTEASMVVGACILRSIIKAQNSCLPWNLVFRQPAVRCRTSPAVPAPKSARPSKLATVFVSSPWHDNAKRYGLVHGTHLEWNKKGGFVQVPRPAATAIRSKASLPDSLLCIELWNEREISREIKQREKCL